MLTLLFWKFLITVVLLSLLLLVSEVKCRNFLEELSQDHPQISKWMIKVLANQGIIMTSSPLPVFADSFAISNFKFRLPLRDIIANRPSSYLPYVPPVLELLSFDFTHSINKYSKTEGNPFPSVMNKNEYRVPDVFKFGLNDVSICNESNMVPHYLNPSLKAHLPDIASKLLTQNLELSFPFTEDNDHFSSGKTVIGCNFDLNEESVSIRMSLPVRQSKHSKLIRFLKIKFIQYIVPGGLCVSPMFIPNVLFQKPMIAIVQNETVFSLDALYGRIWFNLSDCHSTYCQLTDEAREKYLVGEPCLTAIYRNQPVSEIQSLCSLPCRHYQTPSNHYQGDDQLQLILHHTEYPDVIEAENTLYISKVYAPLSLICTNESKNTVFNPPEMGALEMKSYCGCELYYKNSLVWSRKNSLPPICSLDNDNNLHLFQLMPSHLVPFMKLDIPKSELESKLFYNISRNIVAKDLVEEIIVSIEKERTKTKNSWSWQFIAFNVLLGFVTILAYETYRMRRVPGPMIPLIGQLQFIQPILFKRRRG